MQYYQGFADPPNTPKNDYEVKQQTTLKKMFRSNKSAHFLRRPSLFIGNLGTTHHGNDNEKPNTKFSEKYFSKSWSPSQIFFKEKVFKED